MLTRGRIFAGIVALILLAVAYTGWQSYTVQRDLTSAESSVARIQSALDAGDEAARDAAVDELIVASESAADTTGGVWWGAMTFTPLLGDDFEGIEVLSSSLNTIASKGIRPVAEAVVGLDGISRNGRLDLDKVRALQDPLSRAASAFSSASSDVGRLDSSGYLGVFGSRFDDYALRIDSAASSLRSADTAVEVLPNMLGAQGEREYLLIFQNNAEVRATGGLPGSWAQIHAKNGKLEIVKQGGAGDFPIADRPVLPLTDEEIEVYGEEYGVYFQDPGFSPDFQRAGELWRAHWDLAFPRVPIDAVIAIDPVALSYLVEGTGPVQVRDKRLTRANLVAELLSKPYIELEPVDQDALFEEAARAVFNKATGNLDSPVAFVTGISRAAREGRFLVAPFLDDELEALEGTAVLGELTGDDDRVPHVDIGLNDATGSKMSYYLRTRAEVETRSCAQGIQKLSATLTLRQSIAPAEAAKLPVSVTGGGFYGTEAGSQLNFVRLYAPYGGDLTRVRVNGDPISDDEVTVINGRPVVTLAILVENRRSVVVTWAMSTGADQTDDIQVSMTPGILPGNKSQSVKTSCPQV